MYFHAVDKEFLLMQGRAITYILIFMCTDQWRAEVR